MSLRKRAKKEGVAAEYLAPSERICSEETNIKTNSSTHFTTSSHHDVPETNVNRPSVSSSLGENTYWLTRVVFVRMVCFIYFIAFLVAYNQNEALIGSNGLLPARSYLERVKQYHTQAGNDYYWELPTVFWWDSSDWALQSVSVLGLFLSGSGLFFGFTPMPLMLTLWILYTSLDNVGQLFYGYGWEMQLLETGFLAIFLCPLWSWDSLPRHTPPSLIIILLCRWLVFRIMLGAGLIKIRSVDKCWVELRCMDYHYETQPIPNPLSWWFHHSPQWFHSMEVMVNHIVELAAPWLIFAPWRHVRNFAGVIQILFQFILILSGNLSFLNWLTLTPAITCLDDKFLSWILSPILSKSFKRRLIHVLLWKQQQKTDSAIPLPKKEGGRRNKVSIKQAMRKAGGYLRMIIIIAFALLVGYLSMAPVQNLISPRQAMNMAFDKFKLVNTYGAFGTVGSIRHEIIIKGTSDINIGPMTEWKEYEWKGKPGNVSKTPPIRAPYQLRLDWQAWFAAMQRYEHNPWLVHFVYKLLHNDEKVLGLLSSNPFPSQPPQWIKIDKYRYSYTRPDTNTQDWWTREYVEEYLMPLNRNHDGLRNYIKTHFGYNY